MNRYVNITHTRKTDHVYCIRPFMCCL